MKPKFLVASLSAYLALTLPLLASAKSIQQFIDDIKGYMGSIMPILVGAALIVFIWGLIKFIGTAGDETGRTEGKQRMLWGIIALFVIVSIWGIVTFLQDATGTGTSATPDAPGIPGTTAHL